MARNFNGGTDHVYYTVAGAPAGIGAVSLWLKTTQAAANVAFASYWSSGSRNGWGLLLNASAGKITAQGYTATSTPRVNITSTTSVNDGNWHHVAFNYNRNSGGSNQLYIDGVQEASANSISAWTTGSTDFFIQLGDDFGAFWTPYVGDLQEVAHWMGSSQLDAEQIAALAKGFAPPRVKMRELSFYAPLVRETRCLTSGAVQNSIAGGSVADHSRVIGGTV